MKLTRLIARNFKGLNFELTLTDINFLVGSNFAGKTARTDAIRFLLLGYLPELGKTNTATFGLASGRDMEVEGTFDSGDRIRRRLYLDGNSVKKEEIIPTALEFSPQLAVMLNAETYFELTPQARTNYVFAHCPIPAGYSPDAILDKVTAAMPEGEPAKKVANSLVVQIDDAEETAQQLVDRWLEQLSADAKTAKDYAARMEKTVQGISTLKAGDAAGAVTSLPELDTRRAAVTKEIEDLQARKATVASALAAIEKARTTRRTLEDQIRGRGPIESKLGTLRERLLARTTQVINQPVSQEQIEALQARTVELAYVIRTNTGNAANHAQQVDALQHQLLTIETQTTCPYCGATGTGWKALKEADLRTAILAQQDKRDETLKAAESAKATLARVDADLADAKRIQTEQRQRNDEIAALRREIEQTEPKLQAIDTAEQHLATLPVDDPAVIATGNELATALTAAQTRLLALDETRKAAMAREQDKKRLAEAETERDGAKETLAAIVAAGKKLREIQKEMVKAAFEPLLQTANSFFGSVLKSQLAYNDGEIGSWRDGVWVGHRTMSGTEKLLTYAAIQAALSAKSPVRIMLLDELGRLDETNVNLVAKALTRATEAKHIDQVVGIDTGRHRLYHGIAGASEYAGSVQVIEIA